MNFEKYIKEVPDFPKKGIMFKDCTPILENPVAFKEVIDQFGQFAKEKGANIVVGPEARGFIFGTPLAVCNNLGFVPVRKPGKLPREVISQEYELEYGTDTLEMHKDAIKKGDKVVICDDLLATGGTVKAIIEMVNKLGGEVVGCCFLIELDFLAGREKLGNTPICSLIHY